MTTAFITRGDCRLHDMGTHHSESPSRLRAVEDQLTASGVMNFLRHEEAPLATREQLERVHGPEYITALERAASAAASPPISR